MWHRLIIVNSCDGYVYAVDRDTHREVWHAAPPLAENDGWLETVINPPVVAGDVVYVDAGTTFLSALRATDGTRLWRSAEVGQTSRELAVSERWIYALNGAYLFVIDRATGFQRLRLSRPNIPDGIIATPALVSEGRVFVGVSNADWTFDEP